MKTFTVTVAGTERFDGEAPYTWVVAASDMASAIRKATAYHALSQDQRLCDLEIDSLRTFEGHPLRTVPTTGTICELRSLVALVSNSAHVITTGDRTATRTWV